MNRPGQVAGGHLCYGNTVRTTAELLLVDTQDWRLGRKFNIVTGFRELLVEPKFVADGGTAA